MKLKKLLSLLVLVAAALLAGIEAKAQMAQFQALYIYNFAKNIGWPTEDKAKDMVVTVIGDNEVFDELAKLSATKKIGARQVVVKKASSPESVGTSDIVYLGETKSSQIANLVSSRKGSKTLVISGRKGLCANGACIAFVSNGTKLGYEISKKNIEGQGLSVLVKLLQLGTEVD